MAKQPPIPDDDFANPYAAPEAELLPGASGMGVNDPELVVAEEIRREHLNHETNVKGLGILNIAGGALCFIGAAILGIMLARGDFPGQAQGELPETLRFGLMFAVGVYIVIGLINIPLGFGLRALQPWARWTMVVLCSIGLLGVVLNMVLASMVKSGKSQPGGAFCGILIYLAFLYLMLANKANMVFSAEYKRIIAKTPHIRYRISRILVVLLVVVAVLLGVAIIGGVIAALNR